MTKPQKNIAKLFMHGRSQAVRLPTAYRLPGTAVRVSHVGRGILLEPVAQTPQEIQALLDELDRLAETHGDFMPGGRDQPPMPDDDDDLPSFGDVLP